MSGIVCLTPVIHVPCVRFNKRYYWMFSSSPCSQCLMTEYRTEQRVSSASFPRLFPCFLPRHGSRRTFHHPSPSWSPFLWVHQGIWRACRGDDIGARYYQFAVLARVYAQLSSPCEPPRHHGTKLEGRCFPVSGECPGPSQNQGIKYFPPLYIYIYIYIYI